MILLQTTSPNWTEIAVASGASVTAILVLIGLIFAAIQVHLIDKARAIDTLTSRSQRWDEKSVVESRLAISRVGSPQDLTERLKSMQPGLSRDWYIFMTVPHFFVDLGIATLKSKAVKSDLVHEFFGPPIEYYWSLFETYVRESYRGDRDDRMLEWFEKLAEEMDKIKQKRQK